MPKQTTKSFAGFLFAIGVLMAVYNIWADKAYSGLNAGMESAAFPFYHPIKVYGRVIESGSLMIPLIHC